MCLYWLKIITQTFKEYHMSAWIVFLIIALVCFIIEIYTPTMFFLNFAVAGAVPEVRGQGLTVYHQQPAPGEALLEDGKPRPCVVWMSQEAYESDLRKAKAQAEEKKTEDAQAHAEQQLLAEDPPPLRLEQPDGEE